MGEILRTAAEDVLWGKISGFIDLQFNRKHLETMGKGLFKRIGSVLSGNVFDAEEAIQTAANEILKAFSYYMSQAS